MERHAAWLTILIHTGIVVDDGADVEPPVICFPAFSQVRFKNGITVTADPDRVIFSTVDPFDENNTAPSIAKRYLRQHSVQMNGTYPCHLQRSLGVVQRPTGQNFRLRRIQRIRPCLHGRIPFFTLPNDSQVEVCRGADFVRWITCLPETWPRSPVTQSDLMALGMFASRGSERFPVLLVDALRDLDQVADEAGEEGFPAPSEVAARNAAGLLTRMFALSDRRYEIYPTPDGEIAIDAPDGRGRSVLVLCASGGDILCLVNMKTGHRRARYSTAATLPDGFISEALAELDRTDH